MKSRRIVTLTLATVFILGGCATDSELTPKEKERIEREQQREAQKQARQQEKMMRETSQPGQRRLR